MHPAHRSAWLRSVLAFVVLAAGCGGVDEAGPETVEAADSALEGLTREQIREQAQPMTPERAEALGIVDTTIHIEDPTVDLDTIIPVQVPPRDTLDVG